MGKIIAHQIRDIPAGRAVDQYLEGDGAHAASVGALVGRCLWWDAAPRPVRAIAVHSVHIITLIADRAVAPAVGGRHPAWSNAGPGKRDIATFRAVGGPHGWQPGGHNLLAG